MTPNRRTFLKQVGFGGVGLGLISILPGCETTAPIAQPSPDLPRSTPEAEGVSSAGIQAFLDAIPGSKHELHSFMMIRHGRVVAEGWWAPYAPTLNHTMYSMSKSFTSTAVGFAVSEGRLTVDDLVSKFFPQAMPEHVSANLAALRVKHLLTMSVGNEKEPTGVVVQSEDWVKTFLAQPITHAPGSTFLYNSVATYMCSAIVQKVTGQKVIDYLRPRLFEPLAIQGMTWETCPHGINTGGWGLSIKTEGLAKFGQLYLQKGKWNDRQVIPAKWVEEATTFKIQQPLPAKPARPNEQNDWLQGYCYQFWRCQHNGFRGDGAFGQYTIVLPEKDAVIVMTGESSNMQGELDLVWEHLFPALQDQPLPANPTAQGKLRQTLLSLSLNPPKGQFTPPTAALVSGKTYRIADNSYGFENATFQFQPNACLFTLKDRQLFYPILCGMESWHNGETAMPGTPPRIIAGGAPPRGTKARIAASGTWKDANTFEMIWRYYETPHHDTVTCHFEGDEVKISFLSSIAAIRNAKDGRPVLVGKA